MYKRIKVETEKIGEWNRKTTRIKKKTWNTMQIYGKLSLGIKCLYNQLTIPSSFSCNKSVNS